MGASPIYIPSNSVLGFFFSTSLPTLIISCLFDSRHSDTYDLISHCGSDLCFLDNPAILFLGIYPKKMKTVIQKDICAPMFIAALFAMAKIWKQPKCPSTDKWIKM